MSSAEGFFEQVKKQSFLTLDSFSKEGIAPKPKLILELHGAIYDGLLENAGKFRTNAKPSVTERGLELCRGKEIKDLLEKASERLEGLVKMNYHEKVREVAAFTARFLEILPFDEVPGSNYIHRNVAICMLYSHIGHAFGRAKENFELDERKFSNAAEWHYELAAPKKLEDIVKKMAGPHLKLVSNSPDRGPEHGY